MSSLRLVYDADEHGIATKDPHDKNVAIGCTYRQGEIDDFSAGDMVGIGIAGCMLFSMGAQARQDGLDITGTSVDIEFNVTKVPFPFMDRISLVFNVPRDFAPKDRKKLEDAAGRCPLKASFRPETTVTATFNYAGEMAAVR